MSWFVCLSFLINEASFQLLILPMKKNFKKKERKKDGFIGHKSAVDNPSYVNDGSVNYKEIIKVHARINGVVCMLINYHLPMLELNELLVKNQETS